MNRIISLAIALLSLGVPARAGAQDTWDPARLLAGRAELRDLLERLEQSAASPAYSASTREAARQHAARVRARLQDGDFSVGDRVYLSVERRVTTADSTEQPNVGGSVRIERVFADTFTVAPGRVLRLPNIGDVPLAGVLRTELQTSLLARMREHVQDPIVRASPLIRVLLVGGVLRRGFHYLPPQALVSDAIMAAGGPSPQADMQALRIDRRGEPLLGAEALSTAMVEGSTLGQLDVQPGDEIVVPEVDRTRSLFQEIRLYAFTIPTLLFTLERLLDFF